ncbi:bifunctional UDP-N-acetylglucosamine diphosphorylase/glucosamine-1-phosphate N-acetyltransferase GlmU [Agitococcus lubricus]|uniref:Bifunctional protein GlmU n=1 Tax=Agitococcus lubricus TaxID=1077255 RepID=A0A2T5J377_9GAMM|nr:bifunctional UDP-N-acetylglucosamine diphosphorylase/glucosamine-1-phosphate N-acetyltransferase GlmU [Agitococcus lubricus]PTQ91060.1 bifunctional UDP-N-acetylglucosamine pyrophosphorylase/glucosamine-1-phosphate N-acetyltransferase [Agitococcus lubricus]
MELSVLILAAGKGTRMKSVLPKVMQPLAGKPLLSHVLSTAKALAAKQTIVVYGHGGEVVQAHFSDDTELAWALQAEQKGTGHAVQVALAQLAQTGKTLILYGDVPLTTTVTLQQLLALVDDEQSLGLLTVNLPNPTGYGRIVRDNGLVQRIVEQKDANEQEKQITEVNTGILCVPNRYLHQWLPTLKNNNAQGEYYLTDIIALAVEQGIEIKTHQPQATWEVEGINDKVQLANLERVYQRLQAESLMRAGATMIDPTRFDLRGTLTIGMDVSIDVNVVIEGENHFADGVIIGANCSLKNCRLGQGVQIKPNSVLEGAEIGAHSMIGPFARIRPQTILGEQVHIGNFVETKNTLMASGAKANHLSYLGDSEIGARANIGAGTITCNYDGVNKSKTTIGADAFIGSNASLVAPVTIGDGATTGAGSTITKDVPANTLAVARGLQRHIEGWQRPRKSSK